MTPAPFKMRSPCRCGSDDGRIETRGGQYWVFWLGCGAVQYNAPRVETGRAERTVESVHNGIKPKQRARIIERDNGRCVNCGKSAADCVLHVGHIVSVK